MTERLNEFVIADCDVADAPDLVVTIEKQRPEWQQGHLNLPGGKIEAGESPAEAAYRELLEETGMEATSLRKAGEILTEFDCIHIFQATVGDYMAPADTGTGEQRIDLDIADFTTDSRVIPNLRVIVPLIRHRVPKFEISPLDDILLSDRWSIRFHD